MRTAITTTTAVASLALGGVVFAAITTITLVACQNAVNLDVKYTDAGVDSGGDGEPTTQTPPSSGTVLGAELEGCPCDATQGLGCCLSNVGPPFCTTDKSRCDLENGAFYRCLGPDRNSESVCCWHGSGAGAITALAAQCDAGPEACTTDSDCAEGVRCQTQGCPQEVTIGACGQAPPACPY